MRRDDPDGDAHAAGPVQLGGARVAAVAVGQTLGRPVGRHGGGRGALELAGLADVADHELDLDL